MYEATFKIKHGSIYAESTLSNAMRIEMWCNDHCDLLRISNTKGDLIPDSIHHTVGIQERITHQDEAILITKECLANHEGQGKLIEGYLEKHNCLTFPPFTYIDGTILARVITLDETNLSELYRSVNEDHTVTVEAKREIKSVAPDVPLMMLDSMLPALSDRQNEALVTAFENQYFAIPKEATTEELAAELGIERRTFEEHLRRGTNKLMNNIIDYIR